MDTVTDVVDPGFPLPFLLSKPHPSPGSQDPVPKARTRKRRDIRRGEIGTERDEPGERKTNRESNPGRAEGDKGKKVGQ